MIDGIWWLVIVLVIIATLWILAKARDVNEEVNTKDTQLKRAKTQTNDALQKTLALVNRYFPDYQVSRNTNHLLLTKQGKKIAIITIDKKLVVGQRRLGDIPIINYHRVPNRTQLSANLQSAE